VRYKVWRSHLVAPVVEVGAGDGLLARTFSSQKIVSVDQAIVGLAGAPDPKVVGTLESLPFRAAFARTIVAAEVLEHTGDPRAALLECRRIARPDAKLLLSVPTLPLAPPEALFHRLRSGEWPSETNLARWDPEHERRYRLKDLQVQLEETGWETLEVIPMFGSLTSALHYFAEPLWRKLSGRRSQFAHYGAALDRLWARFDRHSNIAVVCRLRPRGQGEQLVL
jgi:SAM-dependent methyltransferase